MSRAVLLRTAIKYRWKPAEWHLRLADAIGANPVLHTFRHAQERDNGTCLWFDDRKLMLAALAFEREACAAIGHPVEFDAPGGIRKINTNIRQNMRQDNERVRH